MTTDSPRGMRNTTTFKKLPIVAPKAKNTRPVIASVLRSRTFSLSDISFWSTLETSFGCMASIMYATVGMPTMYTKKTAPNAQIAIRLGCAGAIDIRNRP